MFTPGARDFEQPFLGPLSPRTLSILSIPRTRADTLFRLSRRDRRTSKGAAGELGVRGILGALGLLRAFAPGVRKEKLHRSFPFHPAEPIAKTAYSSSPVKRKTSSVSAFNSSKNVFIKDPRSTARAFPETVSIRCGTFRSFTRYSR